MLGYKRFNRVNRGWRREEERAKLTRWRSNLFPSRAITSRPRSAGTPFLSLSFRRSGDEHATTCLRENWREQTLHGSPTSFVECGTFPARDPASWRAVARMSDGSWRIAKSGSTSASDHAVLIDHVSRRIAASTRSSFCPPPRSWYTPPQNSGDEGRRARPWYPVDPIIIRLRKR